MISKDGRVGRQLSVGLFCLPRTESLLQPAVQVAWEEEEEEREEEEREGKEKV